MFFVFQFYGLFFCILSVIQPTARAHGMEAEKASMTCFRIEHGIIWCSESEDGSIEHFVSFLDDDIDGETAYATLMDFLDEKKAVNPREIFLLTCISKCATDESIRKCTCHDSVYQNFDGSHLKSFESESGVASNPSRETGLPRDLDFFFVGSEKLIDVSTKHYLQKRNLQTPTFDCRRFYGKSPEEVNEMIMDIVRQRYQQGFYTDGSTTPMNDVKQLRQIASDVKTKIATSEVKTKIATSEHRSQRGHYVSKMQKMSKSTRLMNHIVEDVKTGNVEYYRQKKTTKIQNSPRGQRRSQVITTTRRSPGGRKQTQVIRRTNQSPSRKISPRKASPRKASPGKVSPRKESPQETKKKKGSPKSRYPPSPTKGQLNEHLLPKNNKVVDWDESGLPLDQTPNIDRKELSEPVDADELTKKLLAVQKKRGETDWT